MTHYLEYIMDEYFSKRTLGYFFLDDESFNAFIDQISRRWRWLSVRAYHGIKKVEKGNVVIGEKKLHVSRIYSGMKAGWRDAIDYPYIEDCNQMPQILKTVFKVQVNA